MQIIIRQLGGNKGFFQRAHRADAFMGLFVHHQCPFSYRQHRFRIITIKRHYTRFINYYFIVMDNEGIGCTQVDRDFLGEKVE